jgi:hypothetical protein
MQTGNEILKKYVQKKDYDLEEMTHSQIEAEYRAFKASIKRGDIEKFVS